MNRDIWTIKKYQKNILKLEYQLRHQVKNEFLLEENERLRKELEEKTQKIQVMMEQSSFPKLEVASKEFWDNLYRGGGTSGNGSYNRLAEFKAEIVNTFVQKHDISTIIELGCGDGNQLTYMNYPKYVGVDVSSYVIEKNQKKFSDDKSKEFFERDNREGYMKREYDLSISLDVIFHLLEEDIYCQYMDDLFALSNKYVIIYSSNYEAYTPWPEFRHRNFMHYIQQNKQEEWELCEFIPNKYPYLIGCEEDTSCSDFYIFKKKNIIN